MRFHGLKLSYDGNKPQKTNLLKLQVKVRLKEDILLTFATFVGEKMR